MSYSDNDNLIVISHDFFDDSGCCLHHSTAIETSGNEFEQKLKVHEVRIET